MPAAEHQREHRRHGDQRHRADQHRERQQHPGDDPRQYERQRYRDRREQARDETERRVEQRPSQAAPDGLRARTRVRAVYQVAPDVGRRLRDQRVQVERRDEPPPQADDDHEGDERVEQRRDQLSPWGRLSVPPGVRGARLGLIAKTAIVSGPPARTGPPVRENRSLVAPRERRSPRPGQGDPGDERGQPVADARPGRRTARFPRCGTSTGLADCHRNPQADVMCPRYSPMIAPSSAAGAEIFSAAKVAGSAAIPVP